MNRLDSQSQMSSSSLPSQSLSFAGITSATSRAIPHFSHQPIDLSKKNKTKNQLTTYNQKDTSLLDLSKNIMENSVIYTSSNVASLTSPRLRTKQSKPSKPSNPSKPSRSRTREVAPKVLNASHDLGFNTEGNSIEGNLSRNEIRIMTLPAVEEGPPQVQSPQGRRQPPEVQNPNSSRFYLNQNTSINNGNRAHNSTIDISQNNPPEAVAPTVPDQTRPNTEVLANTSAITIPEITPDKAEDWQHELSVKANHKFGIVQWSLVFITLASLMAFASLSGETPANVLYIILLLNNILHIYSVLRFFERKSTRTRKGLNKIVKLSDWIILTIYSFGSLFKTQNKDAYLIVYLVPVAITIPIRIIFLRKKTSMIRVVLWAQLFVFTLKVDDIFTLSWYLTFAIAFATGVGFIFRGFHIMYLLKNKKKLMEELTEELHQRILKIKLIGMGWDLLINCYSILFLPFLYGLAWRLQSGKNNSVLQVVLILAMVYSILLTYLSLKFKYEITRSVITKIIKNDEDHKRIRELLQQELEIGITRNAGTKYLVKVSSTYYQVPENTGKTEKSHIDKKTFTKTTFITVGDLAAKDEDKEEGNSKENGEGESSRKNSPPKTFGKRALNVARKLRALSKRNQEDDKSEEEEEEEEAEEEGEEENEDVSDGPVRTQEDKNCIVCCDNPANTVIMNCGHGGICYHCGLELWKKEEKCYLCRQKISKLLRLNEVVSSGDLAKVQMATTINKNRKINVSESFQDILNDI